MRFDEFSSAEKIKAAATSSAHSIISDRQSNEDAAAQPQSAADAQYAAIKRQQQQLKQRKQQLQMDKLRKRERELAAVMSSTTQHK